MKDRADDLEGNEMKPEEKQNTEPLLPLLACSVCNILFPINEIKWDKYINGYACQKCHTDWNNELG